MRTRDTSCIVDVYRKASAEEKVRIIMEHYSSFMFIVNAYESDLIDTIKEERFYNRRKANGDLGIRGQSSNISNPASDEGDNEVSIKDAVRLGDYVTALRGADRYEEHKAEILTLYCMRKDFSTVDGQLGCLKNGDEMFKRYLMHEFNLATIADSEGVTVEAVKQRFRKAKKKVIRGAVHWINVRSKYIVLSRGA